MYISAKVMLVKTNTFVYTQCRPSDNSKMAGHMYYCMTGRAIWGNISPYCPTRGIAIIDLLYDFRVTIDTGNNEHRYRHGQ